MCPVCRKGFRDADVECVGPWESDPQPYEWDDGWKCAMQDDIDKTVWSPSEEERAEDLGVREELGLPRTRGEEDWNTAAWMIPDNPAVTSASPGLSSPPGGKRTIVLSAKDYADDSAAWEELGARPQASSSTLGEPSRRVLMSAGSDGKAHASNCIIC